MDIRLFQIDAFAEKAFTGNPAAVCPLEAWPDDALMLAIAGENNLSETAFMVGGDGQYHLRWFTPACEVNLCGHATLAAAFVVFTRLEPGGERVRFETRSGPLAVRREGERLVMDFPALSFRPRVVPDGLERALGARPMEVYESREDWMAVLADADAVRALAPDPARLSAFPFRGLIVTAKGGGDVDFVSRFFAPRIGVNEDPVTGAAHCVLAPYWAKRLKTETVVGRQVSARGGTVYCRLGGNDRVELAGTAVSVLEGTLTL